MKIHCLKFEFDELKEILIKYNADYTVRNEWERKFYTSYNLPILGRYTYNEKWVNNHVLVIVKNYKDMPPGFRKCMSKITKSYSYFKNYKKEKPDYKVPTFNRRPKYPIYIISYKRYDSMITMKYLEQMGCSYYIVIKECEKELYQKSLDKKNYKHYTLLCMDTEFEKKQTEMGNSGGIPQRNYCLKHSTQGGHKSHWIIDDNIKGFCYYNRDTKKEMNHYSFFTSMELFRDKINEDVGLLSPNYSHDVHGYRVPYNQNTKNYSCILVNNELLNIHGIQWRKRYNEDVRLSLECISKGLTNIAFNMFLINKMSTGSVKGGNCDIYKYNRKEIKMDKKFIDEKIKFEDELLKHIVDNGYKYDLEYIKNKYDNSNYGIHYGLFLKFIEIYCDYPEYIVLNRKHVDKRPHHRIITKTFDDTLPKITFRAINPPRL